jgi:diguanylate cyclase (GGDEF)-like protein
MMDQLAPLIFAGLALGWAVHAHQLHRRLNSARRDPLTGLLTRAGWTASAQRIIRGPRSAILLLDLDGFKPVNDHFGHQAGDALLRAVGQRLAAWCHSNGVAGRLGGDEFVAALDDDTELSARLAELRDLLARPVRHGGCQLQVTASIGVCRLATLHHPNLTTALGKADHEMYRHKGHARRAPGRDHVGTADRRLLEPAA